MTRLLALLTFLIFYCSTDSNAQTPNFYNSWKLVKITENEINQPIDTDRIVFIDPTGLMAYYDVALDSIIVNGTWKRYGSEKINIIRERKSQYIIRSWTATEIIISPVNNLNRYYYYSRTDILRTIVNVPKW